MLPAVAGASVAKPDPLHIYARARMADVDGNQSLAVEQYRQALRLDPAVLNIARRAYVQSMVSGDKALAMRSASLLDEMGMLPRDGLLLQIGNALNGKQWNVAQQLTERLSRESRFSFLATIIKSWIAVGEGRFEPPVVMPNDPSAPFINRYVDEHVAFQALVRNDLPTALPLIQRALAPRGSDSAAIRLNFAGQLSAKGATAEALALLPDEADFLKARTDIARGVTPAAVRGPLNPAEGVSQLLLRVANDLSSEAEAMEVCLRLARIASFLSPKSGDITIAASRMLTQADQGAEAIKLLRTIRPGNWYEVLAEASNIEALVDIGELDQAIAIAKKSVAVPNANAARYVRLGQLLSDQEDYAGAAVQFQQAQTRYQPDAVPWVLFLLEGGALDRDNRWDAAKLVLEKGLAIAPDEPVLLNYLGYAQLERRQNIKEAVKLLERASALKPDDVSIADSLGWAKYISGDVAGALPILERAASLAPTDLTINEHLGDILWAAGRRFEARYAWNAVATMADGVIADRVNAKITEGYKPEYAAP